MRTLATAAFLAIAAACSSPNSVSPTAGSGSTALQFGGPPASAQGGPWFFTYDGVDRISTTKSVIVGNVLGTTGNVELAPVGPLIHDYDPWSGGRHNSRVEIDLTNVTLGNLTVDGIVAGNDGDLLFLWNGGGAPVNPGTLTIPNATASGSSALNQIWLASGKELRLGNNEGIVLEYIGGFSWIALGGGHTEERAKQLSLEPACIAASVASGTTQNNYDPFASCLDASGNSAGVTSYVRQTASGSGTVTFTGIAAAGAPNSEGRELVFQNTSASAKFDFLNANGGSSGPNQILTPTGGTLTIGPNQSVTFHYDLTVDDWRVDATTGSIAAAIAANTVIKSDGTNPVASSIIDNGGKITVGPGGWIIDDRSTAPTVNNGSVTAGSTNYRGAVTGIGATSTILTYANGGNAWSTRTNCHIDFTTTNLAVPVEHIVQLTTTTMTVQCYNPADASAHNCGDLVYECAGQ